ncbi:MAG: ABC transporter permease [bacterium]|nr:ABC transporter permease [bacterium]
MRKLWITFLKDSKLSFSGLYFYIEIAMALIFIAVMLFVVPENFDRRQTLFVNVELAEPAKSTILQQLGQGETKVVIFDSKDEVKQALAKTRSAVGVSIEQISGRITYEMILQGFESLQMRKVLQVSMEGAMLAVLPGYVNYTDTTVLEKQSERLTDRQQILPIYLTINVAFMGLFIIAAYIFLDKEEGTIRAFAVAPVQVWQYLASKMLIMLIIGTLSSVLVVVALVGTQVPFLLLLGLVASFNLFGTALGLLISSFFDSMAKAMGALYLAVIVLMLASVSYYMPSFNPIWIKWLPSYSMLFSFREILLVHGNRAYCISQMWLFLLFGLGIFLLANYRFKRTLTV